MSYLWKNNNTMKRTLKIYLTMGLMSLLFGCAPKPTFRSVDAEQFAREIEREEVQLVDVRTTEEYAEGHIPGAVNMDVNGEKFDAEISTLDPSRPVALYCRSGRRSKLAAERVVKAGFEVVELDGGFLSWTGDKEP